MNTIHHLLCGVAIALMASGANPSQGAAAPASIPVLDGIWEHPGIPGFEPLASGPTSLVNLRRREGNVGNNRQLVGDYRNPVLKPATAATVKNFGEMSLLHYGFPSPRNQCWPGGIPFEFTNGKITMLQKPDEILILYQGNHQVRHVRVNQPHPAHVTPSWYGDSVGHYDGDTLVVDTVGIRVGPYQMVDWFGTPHSPALHVIERYRLLDYGAAREALDRNAKENFIPDFRENSGRAAKYLQLYFTVEDPEVFTAPWSATITYAPPNPPLGRADEATGWEEDVCAENPNKYGTEKDPDVPRTDKPDF